MPISCRNRHCPKCQGAAARTWLAEREADLLPVGYFHVVFTLPTEVADIAFHNKAVVYDLLFHAASETMLTIAADHRHLGARIGITAVLHTWGSALTHHPHVHMIVPGGGIALDGERWISSRPAFLLPVRVLGKLFRRLFLTRLIALHDAGRLAFFGNLAPLADRRAFQHHLSPVRHKRCRVGGNVAVPPLTGRVEDWRAGLAELFDCATFPAPSTSHAACGFPALRAPIRFMSRLMGPIMPGQLSIRRISLDSC